VRLLLDAHVSGPNVGRRLEGAGHDVRALDQEPALEGLDDDEVLALAATEERILVTHNVADFPRILREWAASQRAHAGVILVYGIDHSEFAPITRGVPCGPRPAIRCGIGVPAQRSPSMCSACDE